MKLKPRVEEKVTVNLRITKQAHELLLKKYASRRTMGKFISGLILEHHERQLVFESFDAEEFLRESFGISDDDSE